MCSLCERIFGSVGRFVVTKACGAPPFRSMRERMIPVAAGDVLEIGIGSGHNLELYDRDRISTLVGVDPDTKLLALAHRRSCDLQRDVRLIEGAAEQLPVETRSIDTVVASYVLCTIPDTQTALAEIRRVLRPQGKLIFLEHAVGRGNILPHVQRKMNAGWRLLAGGCNLVRDPVSRITSSGFGIESLIENDFAGRMRFLGRHIAGIAVSDTQ